MYTVIKRMEISAAHSLKLSYRSKCEDLHGHNWIITVYCRSRELNADGMVVDFSHIKETVKGKLDHRWAGAQRSDLGSLHYEYVPARCG